MLFLRQLREFHQQTGFAAFLGLAVMTAAVEGMPPSARRASSLKTNHQLRRSCGLVEQVWQTTVRFFWMENSTTCLERCVVIFSSFFALHPYVRKAFLVLLIGDRNDNCSCGWNPGLLIQYESSCWLQKAQDISTEAVRHTKEGCLLHINDWIDIKFGISLELWRWKISMKVLFCLYCTSLFISKSVLTELKTWTNSIS